MESFFVNLSANGWIYGKYFKTLEEARASVFKYIEIFYDR